MRRIFDIHLILFSIFILSCGAPEESSSVPTAEDQSTEQKLIAPTNDQHPCEQLDMETFATFIGQSADAIEFRKEDLGNQICSAYLLGDNDDSSYDDLLIFQFDFMKSKDGFPNFNEAIVNILAAETFMITAGIDKGKAVPVREVNAGDKAYIYSAQDYSTLMMHKGNQARYSLTFFRQVGNDGMYEGLNLSPAELEEKLVLLARALES